MFHCPVFDVSQLTQYFLFGVVLMLGRRVSQLTQYFLFGVVLMLGRRRGRWASGKWVLW